MMLQQKQKARNSFGKMKLVYIEHYIVGQTVENTSVICNLVL